MGKLLDTCQQWFVWEVVAVCVPDRFGSTIALRRLNRDVATLPCNPASDNNQYLALTPHARKNCIRRIWGLTPRKSCTPSAGLEPAESEGDEPAVPSGRERNQDRKFQSPNLSLPEGLSRNRLSDRDSLRSMLDLQRRDLEQAATIETFDRRRQSAISLLTDAGVQQAFDVHNANPEMQDRYGQNSFGWSLLMARQLVQAGVNLV